MNLYGQKIRVFTWYHTKIYMIFLHSSAVTLNYKFRNFKVNCWGFYYAIQFLDYFCLGNEIMIIRRYSDVRSCITNLINAKKAIGRQEMKRFDLNYVFVLYLG